MCFKLWVRHINNNNNIITQSCSRWKQETAPSFSGRSKSATSCGLLPLWALSIAANWTYWLPGTTCRLFPAVWLTVSMQILFLQLQKESLMIVLVNKLSISGGHTHSEQRGIVCPCRQVQYQVPALVPFISFPSLPPRTPLTPSNSSTHMVIKYSINISRYFECPFLFQ